MSIYDLMEAVRSGEFELKFKECISINDKIKLFKNYGVVISINEYKNIEKKVASIKEGCDSPYADLEDKVENDITTMSDLELASVSAGLGLNENQQAVFDVLKRMPYTEGSVSNSSKDDDMKFWEEKPYLTGRGLF